MQTEKPPSTTVSPSSAFYERINRQDCSSSVPDEYIPAAPFCDKTSPTFSPPSPTLPQPPSFMRCTVVQVHRSETLEESQEENSDQTTKPVKDLVIQFGNLQSSDNSDNAYVNTDPSASASVPEAVELKESISTKINEEDLKILEQSEKLLKDMVNGLPNKDMDDILSPPESAFMNGDCSGENEDSTFEDSNIDESYIGNEEEIVNSEEIVQRLDLETNSTTATTKDGDITKDNDEKQGSEGEIEDVLTPLLDQSIIDAAPTKDTVVLKEQFNNEFVEAVFYNKIHEYVNVSGYLPPPIPPRCKYKNVLL